MALERDLHDLLYTHDCVIVPGFGGFLTRYRGARLDGHRHVVHPPAKELSFNRHLTRDDGLLTDRVARQQGVAFPDARDRVGAEVAEWRARLDRHGRLEVRSIGTFFTDAQRNLVFQPDGRSNFLKDAHGLGPVSAVPVQRQVPVPLPAPPVRTLPPAVPATPEPGGRQRVVAEKLWAAAVVTAILFSAGAWFAYDRGSNVQWSGPGWNMGDDKPLYAPRTTVPPSIDTIGMALEHASETSGAKAGESTDPIGIDEVGNEEPVVVVPGGTRVATVVTPAPRGRYHIIGGCFSVEENADRFLAGLRGQGFDALLVDQHRGLYRVAYGSYSDRQVALDALAAVRRSGGEGAWLLIR